MEPLLPLFDEWSAAEPDVAPLEKVDWPPVLALGAIVAVGMAVFLYVIANGFVRQPYSDMFDFLRAEFEYERTRNLVAYLSSQHNHQNLIWVRILTALDVQVFHGSAVIFLVAASLSLLMAAAVVSIEIVRSTAVRVVGTLAALLAILLIASTVNAVDCTQPINCVYAIAFGFAVLAIILFERAEAGPRGHILLLTASAVVCGLAAVAGSGAGVAVFPVLIVSAVRNPGARIRVALTLIVGLTALAIVLQPLFGSASAESSGAGPGHVWKMGAYFLAYAGMPWSSVSALSKVRFLIGLATIVVGGTLLWRGSRRYGSGGRLERIGLDLILFSLITGVMAAIGRADENDVVIVSVRYSIFMSAFQVGLICVLTPAIAEGWIRARRYAVPAALAAGLALLAQQVAAGSSVLRSSHMIRTTITAFAAGERRADMHQLIHPDYNFALQIQAECRRRGLYR